MLLAAPRAALAAPMADIWFATDYEFELGVDACEFESTPDLCQRNGSTNVWECKRLGVQGRAAGRWGNGRHHVHGAQQDQPRHLSGTVYEDYLYFHHDQQGSLFNMEDHSGVDKVTGFIYGLSGNDRVHGLHYDADAVYADVLYGGGDDDIIWGHAGSDLINAGSGDDTIWAGGGHDVIHLVSGSNQCSAEAGNDQVFGGDGDDRISLGDGNDSADGIEGADTICGDDGNDVIEGATGNDVLWGPIGDGDGLRAAGGHRGGRYGLRRWQSGRTSWRRGCVVRRH